MLGLKPGSYQSVFKIGMSRIFPIANFPPSPLRMSHFEQFKVYICELFVHWMKIMIASRHIETRSLLVSRCCSNYSESLVQQR